MVTFFSDTRDFCDTYLPPGEQYDFWKNEIVGSYQWLAAISDFMRITPIE